uniref:Uncharacterized protein n=1 Tax=Malurus cyaneus samueli TaxID=2593467 RepID=A0A8C5TJH8_9PASS
MRGPGTRGAAGHPSPARSWVARHPAPQPLRGCAAPITTALRFCTDSGAFALFLQFPPAASSCCPPRAASASLHNAVRGLAKAARQHRLPWWGKVGWLHAGDSACWELPVSPKGCPPCPEVLWSPDFQTVSHEHGLKLHSSCVTFQPWDLKFGLS